MFLPMAVRKLDVGKKVEVRSTENGFLGSWHLATVIVSDGLNCRIQYEYLLTDDGSTSLTESVTVDGVTHADKIPFTHRGIVRPLPPPVQFGVWQLPFGLCVDFFYQDAWWEGVIFDHEDGDKERRIFFPDMGDELKGQIDNLRITQDWDEVTEEWKLRGNWMFLEIIEEIEHLHPLLVSVKQIWYEVQEKNGFGNLKEWTSTSGDVWRNLIKEVVHENTMLTVKQFFSELNSSPGFVKGGRSLEFSEPALQAILNLETDFDNSAILPFIEAIFTSDIGQMPSMDHQLVSEDSPILMDAPLSGNVMLSSALPMQEEQPSVSPNALSLLHLPETEISGTLSIIKKRSKKRKRLEWRPVVDKPEFCPDAISQYNEHGLKSERSTNLKKHLLCLGWDIESANDIRCTRTRYISPEGKVCHSLRQVSKMLEKSGTGTQTCSEVFDLSSPSQEPTIGTTTRYLSPEGKVCHSLRQVSTVLEKSGTGTQTCSEVFVLSSPSQKPTINPEFCPEAVIDYCSLESLDSRVRNDKILKAKKHLVAIGWAIYYTSKGNRRELRYSSPQPLGKTFSSLITACRWCVEQWEAEGQLSTEASRVISKDHAQLDGVKVCEINSKGKKSSGESESSARVLRSRKRAREAALSSSSHHTPRTVLSWLIDNNVVLPRAKVQYRGKKDGCLMSKEGRITRDGIKCNCCQKIYGISNFEVHAGSNCRRRSANIFLEDGRSLLECQRQMKNNLRNMKKRPRNFKKGSHLGKNDYVCSVCHYGGELLLCDHCPSSFHTVCLGMKEVPEGNWFCPSCCCGMCGQSRFNENKDLFTGSSLLTCCQCEHKYHVQCVRDSGHDKLENYPEGNWFCNKRCEQIFFGIRQLLGKPVMVGVNNLTWTLLKYEKRDDFDSYATDDASILETYSKLSVALDVMHECFEPVYEPYTRSDLVEDVIFSRWSELNRLNFQGFYTVLLERNDEVITIATVRVYGEKVAEVPLVATRFQYRRLGMCRIVMDELEKKLKELGVERLVLPAVSSVLNTWTTSFGFSVMKESQKLNFLNYTFLDFQGTTMCEKLLRNFPSVVSSGSTEAHQTRFDHINSKDNADLDGNSPLSEVLQAEQIEGSDIVDQASANTSGGRETNKADVAASLIIAASQQAHLGCQPCPDETSPQYRAEVTDSRVSVEVTDSRVSVKAGTVQYKCYQRRRKYKPVEANKLALEGVATQ